MDRVVSDPDIYRAVRTHFPLIFLVLLHPVYPFLTCIVFQYSAANSKIHKNVRLQNQEAAQPVAAKATGVIDSLDPFLVDQAEACNKDQGYTPPPKKKRKAST